MKLKSKVMLMLALTGMMVVGGVTAMAQETAQTTYKTVNARHEGPNKIVKENLKLTQKWDKTFKQSDKVDHQKVTFVNRYGITLAADMYTPKDAKGKLPALAVAGPFGAVKEQASGLYAQTMAEKGFVTLAFDPSFTGESGGTPRYIASSDINTEDFSAAVDFLSTQDNVDPDRVGLIGICGFGGFALNAAANDTRIKATVASTMYDMSRVAANGYFDYEKDADTLQKERMATRKAISDQRTIDYKTTRGYHPRSLNSNGGWNVTSAMGLISDPILQNLSEVQSAVLVIHGEKAHSRYFSEDAFKRLKGDNKELLIVPGATHTDLYDQTDKIPFDKMADFFHTYLK